MWWKPLHLHYLSIYELGVCGNIPGKKITSSAQLVTCFPSPSSGWSAREGRRCFTALSGWKFDDCTQHHLWVVGLVRSVLCCSSKTWPAQWQFELVGCGFHFISIELTFNRANLNWFLYVGGTQNNRVPTSTACSSWIQIKKVLRCLRKYSKHCSEVKT